ncbi:hypothetical protein [Ornithinimicrobium cryptoxanthini]|uniref:Uncharacterized protein n=1 Tax=Ornithinimicrobium cryptoxanthini TaxID=2934161 RepID=A0ABY4YFC5_9MICO|nr:hypothetical protein [Ornithinimicrobium cryptoxanthini]USQ75475.1 hypothetical protein NF557_12720 [Ornithinimicrobium cryptoxanthini]
MTDEALVGNVVAWAGRKQRAVDAAVLESVLRARGPGAGVGRWPPGSVVDLLLVRWPKSQEELPEQETLASTLETFWRFLRATGLMAHGSAEPKALLREFGRAAVRLWVPGSPEQAVSEDLAWFSPSSPAKTATAIRRSVFILKCLWLADWVGEGVATSDRGFPPVGTLHDVVDYDVVEPDLMWLACVRGGLIEVTAGRAVQVCGRPHSDEEWVHLGLQLVVSLLLCLDLDNRDPALYALAGLWHPGFNGWEEDELAEGWWRSEHNRAGHRAQSGDRERSADAAYGALILLEELGVLDEPAGGGRRFAPTALGHDVALAVMHLGLQGAFLEDTA